MQNQAHSRTVRFTTQIAPPNSGNSAKRSTKGSKEGGSATKQEAFASLKVKQFEFGPQDQGGLGFVYATAPAGELHRGNVVNGQTVPRQAAMFREYVGVIPVLKPQVDQPRLFPTSNTSNKGRRHQTAALQASLDSGCSPVSNSVAAAADRHHIFNFKKVSSHTTNEDIATTAKNSTADNLVFTVVSAPLAIEQSKQINKIQIELNDFCGDGNERKSQDEMRPGLSTTHKIKRWFA